MDEAGRCIMRIAIFLMIGSIVALYIIEWYFRSH